MKIYSEIPLSRFEFWSGAKEFAAQLTEEQFDMVDSYLEDNYPDGISETDINDLFWFDQNLIRELADMPCEELNEVPEEAQKVLADYYDLDTFSDSTEAVEEYKNREIYYIPESYKEKYTSVRECYENALDEDELFDDDDNENGNRDILIWFGSIDDGYIE